jgi:hypothetical protein
LRFSAVLNNCLQKRQIWREIVLIQRKGTFLAFVSVRREKEKGGAGDIATSL